MADSRGNGPQAEPEILPPGTMPDYGYQQPAPPPRPRRSGWQLAPATYILTASTSLSIC